jgi:multiple sugar transport system substrate-binding protein
MSVLSELSRRKLLRTGALGGVGVAVLAACGETKEVIKEVPVEVIKEVQVAGETVVKEVQVEVPVEVIKEVEKIVEVAGETTVVEKIVEVQAEVVTTTVNAWFNQATQMANFEEKVQGHYHRQQDLFRLESILVPNSELTTKMTAAIAGGAPPDVVRVGGGTLGNAFFRQGVMHDIDQFDPTVRDNEDIVGAIRVTLTWNDKIWAMPVNSGTAALYYNRSLYDAAGIGEPPVTFPEMVENAAKIQSLGTVDGNPVVGMEMPTEPKQGTANTMQGVMFGNGAFGVDEAGTKVLLDSPEMLQTMTWLKEGFVDPGTMPIKQNLNETGMTNDFGTGLVGQYIAYPSRLQNAIENLGIDVGLTARHPAGPVADFLPIGFGHLMLPTNAENTEGGWHFTDFIGNDPENDSIWCAAFGQIPPRFSYRDSVTFSAYRQANPGTQPFIDGQANAFPQYWGPAVNQLWSAFGEAQEAVVFGEDPASALGDAQERAQAALDTALETDEATPRTFPELTGGYM